MFDDFDTTDAAAARAALVVYWIYSSRDRTAFKVSPDMWGRIERAVISAAKRADSLADFAQRLKPKLSCAVMRPFVDPATKNRLFIPSMLADSDLSRSALDAAYHRASWVILLVRDRLERERLAREAAKAAKADTLENPTIDREGDDSE